MTEIKIGGKIVGNIQDGVYITTRRKEHFMRKYGGYGISEAILKVLLDRGVQTVRIIYDGVRGRKVFDCPVEYYTKSPNVHYFGNDRQKFVPQYLMKEVIEL